MVKANEAPAGGVLERLEGPARVVAARERHPGTAQQPVVIHPAAAADAYRPRGRAQGAHGPEGRVVASTRGPTACTSPLAQALLGPQVRIGRDRRLAIESDLAELVMITAHPSAILRSRDAHERREAMDAFVSDLTQVARWLAKRPTARS